MNRFFLLILVCLIGIDSFSSNDSLFQELKKATQSEKSFHYNNLSVIYQNTNLDSALFFASKAVTNAIKFGKIKELSRGYGLLGKVFVFKGDFDAAENYLDSSIYLAKSRFPEIYLNALLNKAMILENRGVFAHALEIYHQTLDLSDSLGLESVRAQSLNNLGIVYKSLEKYEEALKYYEEALEIKKSQNDQDAIAFILNNMGTLYDMLGDTEKALSVYNLSLEINKKQGNTLAVSYIEHNMAMIYKEMKQYEKALEIFISSLKVAKHSNDVMGIAYNYNQLADLYLKLNQVNKSEELVNKGIQVASDAELTNIMVQNFYLKSLIEERKGQFHRSLDYYKRYSDLKDSLFSAESRKRVDELRMAYEKSRIEKKVQLLEREKKLQKLQIQQNEITIRNRNLWLLLFLIGFILIVGFSFLLFRQVNHKRKANELLAASNAEISQQNEEIKAQRDALTELNKKLESQNIEIEAQNDALQEQRNLATKQRDKIYNQKQNLTDNITYAARIQKAMLPPKALFTEYFTDFFIFNQPQSIVGGDFYWAGKVDSKIVLVAADSTGHGVTGGFMSVLGISILNEIVLRKKIVNPGQILNEARDQIISSLHQSSSSDNSKDGMDVTVFCFDKATNTYEFAAANQKAYKVNSKTQKLEELKGDGMPVAFYADLHQDFTVHQGDFSNDDVFYLFSDGYPDQFGGNSNKKFLYKRFRKLVERSAPLTMAEQLDMFATTFYQWKGSHDQVDDLLVLGIIV